MSSWNPAENPRSHKSYHFISDLYRIGKDQLLSIMGSLSPLPCHKGGAVFELFLDFGY